VPRTWRNVDRYPNIAARDCAAAVVDRLANLSPAKFGAPPTTGGIPALRFDDEAQEAFDTWRATLEERLRGDIHPAFEAHLSKYRSLLPSLALIIHLMDGGAGPVGIIPFSRAEAWCEFLELAQPFIDVAQLVEQLRE
jgi:hypothetical protein